MFVNKEAGYHRGTYLVIATCFNRNPMWLWVTGCPIHGPHRYPGAGVLVLINEHLLTGDHVLQDCANIAWVDAESMEDHHNLERIAG